MAKSNAPYIPPEYKDSHVAAFRALAEGVANEDQQKIAYNFILHDLCDTYGLSYRPASDRDTAFAEGKRFVGLQVVKLTKLNSQIAREDNG